MNLASPGTPRHRAGRSPAAGLVSPPAPRHPDPPSSARISGFVRLRRPGSAPHQRRSRRPARGHSGHDSGQAPHDRAARPGGTTPRRRAATRRRRRAPRACRRGSARRPAPRQPAGRALPSGAPAVAGFRQRHVAADLRALYGLFSARSRGSAYPAGYSCGTTLGREPHFPCGRVRRARATPRPHRVNRSATAGAGSTSAPRPAQPGAVVGEACPRPTAGFFASPLLLSPPPVRGHHRDHVPGENAVRPRATEC